MEYYVYVLCYPSGEPFYFGKGKGNRAWSHLRSANAQGRARVYRFIREIRARSEEPIVKILCWFEQEKDALEHEQFLIAQHGTEKLANVMPGGWTPSLLEVGKAISRGKMGHAVSAEARSKISKGLKEVYANGYAAWNKGKPWNPEMKQKLSEVHKGQIPWNSGKKTGLIPWNKSIPMNEETRIKVSLACRGRISPMIGRHHSEETKRKLSESHKGQKSWNKGKSMDSEHRNKLSEIHKSLCQEGKNVPPNQTGKHWNLTAETRKRQSEARRRRIK